MRSSYSLKKDKIKIVLLENIHPAASEVFKFHGYDNIESTGSTLNLSQLTTKLKSAYILGVRSRTNICPELLKKAERLIAIGCFCIGTDNVQLDDAAQLGIPVFNAPHSNTRSVAELVIGLAIMLMRGIFPKSNAAHQHRWIKSAAGSNELRGKTMGIIGYGHIGSQVSIMAEALGMSVLYYDIRTKLALGNAAPADNLQDLLQRSDVVTLHVPEDESTLNMLDNRSLVYMRDDACLINASRGRVVDLDSLAHLLRRGKLRGVAIDVFPDEPSSGSDRFDSPLIGFENVILTPHIGGSTREAQKNIGIEVATKLINFSDRGNTEGAVNFPNVNLKANQDTTRFLHIHQNQPGMLKAINEIIASRNINVAGQYLETNSRIGYVVLDIEPLATRQESLNLRKDLQEIPGTIRTRILY